MELENDVLYHLHTGIVFAAVCAPKSWDAERVAKEANIKLGNPGTSAGVWVISDISDDLKENPSKCHDDENRLHWVLNC